MSYVYVYSKCSRDYHLFIDPPSKVFEKLGDARYLSHRNVMDVLERALRAARVPVRYTEGFNPHIRLSMGPALPLGSESRHELFDLDPRDVSLVSAPVPLVLDPEEGP